MGQEDVDLTQTLTGQQRLTSKYRELDTLFMQHIHLWQEFNRDWTEKQVQDIDWRSAIDGKLQTIINLLGHLVPTAFQNGTSQTVAGNRYSGQCFFITS